MNLRWICASWISRQRVEILTRIMFRYMGVSILYAMAPKYKWINKPKIDSFWGMTWSLPRVLVSVPLHISDVRLVSSVILDQVNIQGPWHTSTKASKPLMSPARSIFTNVEGGMSMASHSFSVASNPDVKSRRSERWRYFDICKTSINSYPSPDRRLASVSLLDEKARSLGTADAWTGMTSRVIR